MSAEKIYEYRQLVREVLKIRKAVNVIENDTLYKPAILLSLAKIIRSARALAGVSEE